MNAPAIFVLWSNGMLMVFDKAGEQVKELQGLITDRIEQVAQYNEPGTLWQCGVWGVDMVTVSREWFFATARSFVRLKAAGLIE